MSISDSLARIEKDYIARLARIENDRIAELRCAYRARDLYQALEASKLLKDHGISLMQLRPGAYCFKVLYPPGLAFSRVSCSVPGDAPGNRGPLYGEDFPGILETALFDDYNLISIEELGYDVTCRFESDDEIIKELVRLAGSKLNGP